METKKKYIYQSLGAIVVIQLLSVAYGMFQIFKINQETASIDASMSVNPISAISLGSVLIMVFAGVSAKLLKEEKPLAWVLAICACLMALASWALPAAVVGLLYLADKTVRDEYIQKMDLQF